MNARRPTDFLMLQAGALTLVGLAAREPAIALAGTVLGLAACRGLARPTLAAGRSGRRSPEVPERSISRSHTMFRTSSGSDADASEPGSSTSQDDDAERGSRSYEEFAAGLEEESEEISFLPHYVSGGADAPGSPGHDAPTGADGGRGAGSTVGGPGSAIMSDLDEGDSEAGRMPVPRRFALGTVAVIRRLLDPADVERILVEQRRYPRLRFGDIAVQLGLLSEDDLQELLRAQQEGVFSEEEIAEARSRLAAFHRRESD